CLDYSVDLSTFGDLLTKGRWSGALSLAEDLQSSFGQQQKIRLYSQPHLDYGTAIPLLLLNEALDNVKILPIGYIDSNDCQKQAEFGELLGDFLRKWPGKVAIIGSGDLAHCLGAEQPNGLQARGKKFDQRLQEALRTNNQEALLNISSQTASETGQCAWLAYATLQAIMKNQPGNWHNLSYEAPFGVGGAVWQWRKDEES
ncbi:MAG TPA: MEMO1 family protein, partial [bacterium]|nr:MEMO1 family protein [bacterium]